MLENALGTYPSAGLGILAPIRLWRVLYALQPCSQLFELQGVSFALQPRLWLSALQKDLPVWSFPCCGQELPYPGWKSGAPWRNFTQFSSPVWLLPSSLGEGLGPNGGGKCNSLCSWSLGDPNQLSQPTRGHWKLAKDLAGSLVPTYGILLLLSHQQKWSQRRSPLSQEGHSGFQYLGFFALRLVSKPRFCSLCSLMCYLGVGGDECLRLFYILTRKRVQSVISNCYERNRISYERLGDH